MTIFRFGLIAGYKADVVNVEYHSVINHFFGTWVGFGAWPFRLEHQNKLVAWSPNIFMGDRLDDLFKCTIQACGEIEVKFCTELIGDD